MKNILLFIKYTIKLLI